MIHVALDVEDKWASSHSLLTVHYEAKHDILKKQLIAIHPNTNPYRLSVRQKIITLNYINAASYRSIIDDILTWQINVMAQIYKIEEISDFANLDKKPTCIFH